MEFITCGSTSEVSISAKDNKRPVSQHLSVKAALMFSSVDTSIYLHACFVVNKHRCLFSFPAAAGPRGPS